MRFGCLRPCTGHATRLKLEARCFAAVVGLTRHPQWVTVEQPQVYV
jgi:hypothetical protein